MIIADTLIWLWVGDDKLGSEARQALDEALLDEQLAVSAFTFWEVAMLRARNRIEFPEDVAAWRLELLGQGLIGIPTDGEIGIRANSLLDFPADRIIVATALNGHRLVTADQRILNWTGDLDCLDATR